MGRMILIKAGDVELEATLTDTDTAELVWQALPIRSSVRTWGDEIYFTVDVQTGSENPQEIVEKGDIAYWPDGPALCVFFGPTPASRGEEIRPASPVNVIGRARGDLDVLKSVPSGAQIEVTRNEGHSSA